MNRLLTSSAALALMIAPVAAQQNQPPQNQQSQQTTGQSQSGHQQTQQSGQQRQNPQVGIQQYDLPQLGGQRNQSADNNQARRQAQNQNASQQSRMTGRVLLLKEVQQRNGNEPHGVVLMQTRSGRAILVDLGPVSGLRNIPIRRNDMIRVSGFPGRVGNRLVFFVTDVQAGNQRAQVQRPGSGSQQQQMRPEYRQVRGNVIRTRQVNVRGHNQPNLVALVQTQGGQRVLVDLGSAQSMDANLQHGQQITARGREVRVGDRVVLLAHQVQAGEQTYDVNRPAHRRRQS
ncbi:hypothetical protein ACFOYU_19940 [Microvirga sp. GCM10011540]|uniref:hypothetical protein n=1 Tax=Microvirga sp. GCM10011540 TaxID=3317338 RepID=UPI00361DE471